MAAKLKLYLIAFYQVFGISFAVASLLSLFAPLNFFCDLICQFAYQLILGSVLILFLYLNRSIRATERSAKVIAIANGVSLVLHLQLLQAVQTISQNSPPSKDQSNCIKVMQCNVNNLNLDRKKIIATLNCGADILCLQEIAPFTNDLLSEKVMKEAYPYRIILIRSDSFGIGILSRYPLKDCKMHKTELQTASMECTVVRDGQEIKVFSVHTLPPVMPAYYDSRNNEIAHLAACAAQSDSPVLILGDFNCASWSPHMKPIFSAKLKEATAYPKYPPQSWHVRLLPPFRLPLDHIFVSKHFSVERFGFGCESGSDHLPLLATLKMNR